MRRTRRAPVVAGVLLAAAVLAACGSSPGSTGGTTTTSTSTSLPGGATPTSAPRPFFAQHGTGNGRTRTFTARAHWHLVFNYDCSALGHKGSFALTLDPVHGAATKVTSQQGLGGGGNRELAPGTYSLSVTTPCQWSVTGEPAS